MRQCKGRLLWLSPGTLAFEQRRLAFVPAGCDGYHPLCRYSAASGTACGSSCIGVRLCKVIRRCTSIVSGRATLVVCKSLRTVGNAYVSYCCGIIERTYACVPSRWFTFVPAGGGCYPPLCQFSASLSNAGGSQSQYGHEGAYRHVGGRSLARWRTLSTQTLAF